MEEKFVLNLEYMIENTKADKDLSNVIKALMTKDFEDIPIEWYTKKRDLSTRFGLLLYKVRIVVLKALQQTVIHLLHTGHIGYSKKCNEAEIFYWRGMDVMLEEKAQNCKPCIAAGKNLKTKLPSTEKKRTKTGRRSGGRNSTRLYRTITGIRKL